MTEKKSEWGFSQLLWLVERNYKQAEYQLEKYYTEEYEAWLKLTKYE